MNRVRSAIATIGLLLCSFAATAQVHGAATTVDANGVPRYVFHDKNDVFFTAGPATPDCAFEQFVDDGAYYFQVTDITGRQLLSSDPVTERAVTVRGGVLGAYEATTHSTQEARGPCGSLTVRLGPFADAGVRDVTYLLWLTPIQRYVDPAGMQAAAEDQSAGEAGPVCGEGCFHGFLPEFSLKTAFRVEDRRFCDESFCVSGTKFEDRNGNGVRDSGEPGIPGVEIHVVQVAGGDDDDDDPDDFIELSGLTGADGAFRVCGLVPGGTFRVTETVPFGFQQTGPLDDRPERRLIARDFGWFVQMCDQNFDGLDFGNQLIPNAIGGIKFEDLNANGVRDPGEPGLSGFTITLTPAAPGAPPVGSVTTDANGNFIFLNVAPGTYTLSETLQQGFSLTVPANNSLTVTLAAGGSSITNEFGNFRGVLTGTISGAKFNDLNANGVRDPGEPGLSGVTITRTASINDPAGTPLSVVTDADGNFTFSNVPFGVFTLTETVPAGFAQTAPPAPGTHFATINFAQRSVTGLLFGNRALAGTISGEKFNDANGNGVRDAGEGGLSGVTIRVTDSAGTVQTTTTDAAGAFSFTGLAAGAYVVSEVVPNGFQQTAPAAPGVFNVNVTTGQPVTGLLFGNRAVTGGADTASISVRKILDRNANGIFEPDIDRGFEGIVFELRDAAGNVRTGTSDANGNFTFTNLPAGTYVLSEVLPPNFFQTFPGTVEAPGTYTITVTTGQAATGFLFLNKC